CLMAEPALVADCVAAMRDEVELPVTVKHRIGLGRNESHGFVRDFIGTVAERGGCEVFIVHARNAWLEGLSPKENREVPPLRHEVVHRLKAEFPRLTIAVNGGLETPDQIAQELAHVDGVMVGRRAYHHPWDMAQWDRTFFAGPDSSTVGGTPGTAALPEAAGPDRALDRDEVEEALVAYMVREQALRGTPWPQVARHMLGLRNGQPGARRWRKVWSDHRLRDRPPQEVARLARAARLGTVEAAEPAAASAPAP
ncbi:MAG: tRNA-dihydrouridine synthase, partial [Rubrivivax sp.]